MLQTIVCDDDKVISIIFMWKQMAEKFDYEFSNYIVFDGISFLLLERSNERWQQNKWQMKIP